nr:E3 ubiquitin protein ligase HECTD1 [Hymenolepis microstoma]
MHCKQIMNALIELFRKGNANSSLTIRTGAIIVRIMGPIARSKNPSFKDSCEMLIRVLCVELSDTCAWMYNKNMHKDVTILNALPLKWLQCLDTSRKIRCFDEIVTILHYLHLLSHPNNKSLRYLLCASNYLAASLATLLFHCGDDVVHGNVICLLESIICSVEFSTNLEIPETKDLLSQGQERLQKDIYIIEAVINNNTERLRELLPENTNALCEDHLGRHPLIWAHCFGTPETIDIIQAHCDKKTEVTTSMATILENSDQQEGPNMLDLLCLREEDASRDQDTETSTAAIALYDSLQIKCHSLYFSLVKNSNEPCNPQFRWTTIGFASNGESHLKRSQLEEIVRGISVASQSQDEDSALTSLSEHFHNLKNFLRRHDHLPMQREIEGSGLISALLNCLAVSKCEFWSNSVGGNTLNDYLDYLLKRRREFLQHFHHSRELSTLFGLLVNIFEPRGSYCTHLFDILPQHKMIEDAEYKYLLRISNKKHTRNSSLSASPPLKGRKLDSSTNYGVLETMAKWFPNLKHRRSPTSLEIFLMENRFLLKLQAYQHDEFSYLNDVKGFMMAPIQLSLNHVISSFEYVFDHWYDCERGEIEIFKPFYEKMGHSVYLVSDDENVRQDFGLQMSLFYWLGTCGGTRPYFINPGITPLVRAYSVQPDDVGIDYENDSFIGRDEIHIKHSILKEYHSELFDNSIFEGKVNGSQFCVDTGLDLIPTAYCLSCIYDSTRKLPITNWCLQGSNDRYEWTNLSVHINDHRIKGKPVIIPLNPRNFRNVQSNHPLPSKISFRLFRIMDMSPLNQQYGICVCGLDFYGEVIGIHQSVDWIATNWDSHESVYNNKVLLYSQMKAIRRGEKFIDQQHLFDDNVDCHFAPSSFNPDKQRYPKLSFHLVARDNEESEVASIEIDKGNRPILSYATALAEALVKRGIRLNTMISLEYYLSNDHEEVSIVTDDTSELLQLTFLLHQMSNSFNDVTISTDEIYIEKCKENMSLQPFSSRLCRLVEHQLADTVSTGLGLNPHWCDALNRQLSILVPFEMRLELFQASALGYIRSLAWVQDSVFGKAEICKLGLPVQPFTSETQTNSSTVLNTIEAYLDLLKQLPSPSVWTGNVITWIQTAFRDITDEDNGSLFWNSAEHLMDNLAEIQASSAFTFVDENGVGDGLSRDFYSELSREFCRRTGGMWLEGSDNTNSHFLHAPFGLFPAPYPRDGIPLQVLVRFHILGISIAKALQDDYLLDLPLSKPFLKIIVNYSNAVSGLLGNDTNFSREAQFLRLEHLENCREQVRSDFDFIRHCNFSLSGNQHWLTGLLDVDDFLIVYPHFKSTLPGLLELYKRHQLFCKNESSRANGDFNKLLDEASVEILGCTLDDLGLSMVFHGQNDLAPLKVKLREIYSWESPQTFHESHSDEDEIEAITEVGSSILGRECQNLLH